MDTGKIRKQYLTATLSEPDLKDNPFGLFGEWLAKAIDSTIEDPTAMTLSTIGEDGFPQSRVVLLKSFDKKGFTFFTNYFSQKGRSIALNNRVALNFFWPLFERQVRVKGTAYKVGNAISDNYFDSRPKESRISVWASGQSCEITSREELEKKFEAFSDKFKNGQIPRPDYWGGYIVKPVSVEFWQGRENRLHDRFLYEKAGYRWTVKRLAP
jgi:pyridoxamine 5'-phosphate oxidase